MTALILMDFWILGFLCLFQLLNFVVHLFGFGSVKTHEAKPDDEGDCKLNGNPTYK